MNPVAFIDDDPMKAHRWIVGVPVRGSLGSSSRRSGATAWTRSC